MESASLPTTHHDTPSNEADAVMTSPFRDSFTHFGAGPAPPYVSVDPPPVTVRRWNASPFPTDTSMNACAEPASSVSRIITPAFAQSSLPLSDATRATIEPSLASDVQAK